MSALQLWLCLQLFFQGLRIVLLGHARLRFQLSFLDLQQCLPCTDYSGHSEPWARSRALSQECPFGQSLPWFRVFICFNVRPLSLTIIGSYREEYGFPRDRT